MRRSAAPVGTTAWLWTPRRPSRLRRDVEQTLREFDLQRGGFAVLAALRRSGTPYDLRCCNRSRPGEVHPRLPRGQVAGVDEAVRSIVCPAIGLTGHPSTLAGDGDIGGDDLSRSDTEMIEGHIGGEIDVRSTTRSRDIS